MVRLQYRIERMARHAPSHEALPAVYPRIARAWWMLGVPAFAAVIAIYGLLIAKPGL